MATLETARLRLVPLGPEHIDDMARLHADPAVMATMKHGVEDRDQTLRRLEAYAQAWQRQNFGMWALFERSTGKFVGECGLVDRSDEGLGIALRFALSPAAQGQGYGREAAEAAVAFAFARHGIDRVAAIARASNVASRRVLEAAGLSLEEEWEKGGVSLVRYARPNPGAITP